MESVKNDGDALAYVASALKAGKDVIVKVVRKKRQCTAARC